MKRLRYFSGLQKKAEQQLLRKSSKKFIGLDPERALRELDMQIQQLKRQNEELRKTRAEFEVSLERYTQWYEFAPAAYFSLDAKSHIIHANQAAARLCGLERPALYQRRFLSMVHEDFRLAFLAFLEKTLTSKHQQSGEFTLQLDDISIIVAIEATAESNHPICQAVVIDITEYSRAEKEKLKRYERLATRENRYKGVLEDQTDIICRFKADGTMLYVNKAFCKFVGQSSESLIGHQWQPVTLPEDLALVTEKLSTLTPSNPVVTIENRIVNAEGQLRWGQFVNRAFFDDDGALLEIQSVCRDITEQKRVDMALAASEKEFRSLAESMPQIVWICDTHGLNIYFNQQWVDYTGLSLEESYGHGWNKPFHPECKQKAWDAWQNAVKANGTYSLECRLRRADGIYRWWLIRGVPVLDEAGGILKWFGTCTDIDEIKQAEKINLRLKRLYQVASATNHVIVHATDRDTIFRESCRIAVDLGGFRLAWVGLLDNETGLISPTAASGEIDYLEGIRISANLEPEGMGPTGKAIRDESFCICNDFFNSDMTRPWRDRALIHNLRASASIVIKEDQAVIGALTLYAGEKDYFDARQEKLLQEMGMDISFALDKLLLESRVREAEIQARMSAERERAAERIRKSRAQLQTFINHAPISMAMFDREMNYLATSDRWLKDYDLGCTGLIGLNHYEVDPDIPEKWKSAHRQGLAGNTVNNDEDLWINANGDRYWLRWVVLPWLDEDGAVGGIIISTENITERKLAEEKLREADRRKDEFLAMLAHELRNPLAPISNAVQILAMQQLDERAPWAQEIIQRQVIHLTCLVDDLLDVSRIATGKIVLKKERLELTEIIKHVVTLASTALNAKRQALDLHLPETPILLHADLVRVTQILNNLLDNAIKYSPEGRRIEIIVDTVGANVEIQVRDQGVGISAELLPKVFDLFQQAESSLDRSQGGLGIGLNLVKSLVGLHGGQVTVASAGLGHGSTFTVCFPLMTEMVNLPESKTPILPEQKRNTFILIVDDDPYVRESSAMLLELKGYQVRMADSGESAIKLIEELHPDAVLMDIGLPREDGYQVCRRIRLLPDGSHLLMVAISGYGHSEALASSLAAGFDHHLVKPVNFTSVFDLLSKHGL